MASVSIISGSKFDVHSTAVFSVMAYDGAGAPVDSVPDIAIFSPARALANQNPWWDGDSWEAAVAGVPPYIAMTAATADATLTGLYTHSFSHAAGFATAEEGVLHLYVRPNGGVGTPTIGTVQFFHTLATQPITDAQFDGVVAIDTVGKLLNVLRVVHAHDQSVDDVSKQLVYYTSAGEGGGNVALRFALKDSAGLSSAREIFKKART